MSTTTKTENLYNFSLLGKVFSLLHTWEKIITLALIIVIAGSVYWNWNIFYSRHSVLVPAYGGMLIEGMIGQPNTINPILATSQTDLTLVRAIFSGLYTYNREGNLVPDLAESMPKISEDGKSYTISLKQDATWQDNVSVTTDDVLFTISAIQNEKLQSPLRNLWLSTSVTKLDSHTIVFTTKEVSGPFMHNLTQPLLPEHVWAQVSEENFMESNYNIRPIGNGPFAIHQIDKEEDGSIARISLSSFQGHAYRPKLDGITLVFYKTEGELMQAYASSAITSFGILSTDTLAEPQKQAQTLKLPLPQYQAIFLNLNSPSLAELPVRQALRTSLDSTVLSSAAWGNKVRPMDALPLGLVKNTPTPREGDQGKAKLLLDQAGWKLGKDGVRIKNKLPLHITLATSNANGFTLASQQIATTWESLGIKVTVIILPANELIAKHVRPRNYDALLFSENLVADPDAFVFWHSSQVKDPGLNVSGLTVANIDKLIIDARTTTEPEKRALLYEQLENLLEKQVPAIYVNQSLFTYVLDDKIKGTSTITSLIDPSWRLAEAVNFYVNTNRVWQ